MVQFRAARRAAYDQLASFLAEARMKIAERFLLRSPVHVRVPALAGRVIVWLFAAVLASSALAAEDKPFTKEELEQVAAPIALYPDPLVAQILMASTYP